MQSLQKIQSYRISPRRIKGKSPLWGFEMVEALVAIVILTLAIIGPMALAVQTAKYSRVSLDRVVGSYLADEGLDLMINYRQSLQVYCEDKILSSDPCEVDNLLVSPPFASLSMFLDDFNNLTIKCSDASAGCVIDVDTFDYGLTGNSAPKINTSGNNGGIKKAIDNTCPVLYVSNSSWASCASNLNNGEATKFTRVVYVREVDGAEIKKCHSLTSDDSNCLTNSSLTANKVAEVVSIVCPNAPANQDGGVICNENSENAIVVRAYVTS